MEINFNIPMSFFALKLDGFFPVFRVGSHVLIEKFTGKTFLYKAVDLGTREITSLFYTKTRLTEKKYKTAVEKMTALCEIESEKPKAELKTGLELLIEKNRVIFTYVLTRYGYGIREKQIELASQMLTALRGMKISISEAAVGTGKTHAYIIAAVLQKLDGVNDFWIRNGYQLSSEFHTDTPMPIVISTSSIALQRAITRDYIPEISRILLENRLIKRPLSCVVKQAGLTALPRAYSSARRKGANPAYFSLHYITSSFEVVLAEFYRKK
jgi:ATP-dependent DNA helicase DinG